MAGEVFSDATPSPDPAPKKVFIMLDTNGKDRVRLPWTAGQTLQQALGSAIPAAIRQHTNAFNSTIEITLRATEN